MGLFGIKLKFIRQPRPKPDLIVIRESLESHKDILVDLAERLGDVEKKAEATRRKVYREEDKGDGKGEGIPLPPVDLLAQLSPGDLPPENMEV